MPQSGGSTTQSGIYYQNSVTALYLGRMLRARPGERVVASVRAEAPESVDDTVAIFADGGRDFVQAKETLPGSGKKWKKLWTDFVSERRDSSFVRGQDRLILVTADPDAALLREVAKRAGGATSAAEWLEALNQDQRTKVLGIEKAAAATTAAIYDVFSTLRVDIRDAEGLEADRIPLDIPQSTKSQIELFRLLRDRVGGEARYKQTFDRVSLLASIQKEDVAFALHPEADEAAIDQAAKDVGDVLRGQKATFGSTTQHLARLTTGEVVAWARAPESLGMVAMLLGDAGRGKTVVLRDALLELESAGVTVVAVKADVQLAGVRSPDEMQRRLLLPESLSRVLTVVGRAGGPVVFLVDQVDALSHNLAQDGTTLDVVLDAVLRSVRLPHVRVVLSCRTFDAASDPRLRRLDVKKEFRLAELPDDDVKAVLATAGVSYDDLSVATRALLRTPLHLDVFLWVKQHGGTPDGGAPAVLQDLYAALMRDIALVHETGAPPVEDRERALLLLADAMAAEQRTTVPLSALRGDAGASRAMPWLASHGIVTITGDRASFLHQTFFDYLYARRFVDRRDSLVTHILTSPQALRQRTELVQILTYARGAEPATYMQWLDALYAEKLLRPHLHRLLVSWFGRLPNPSAEEIAWVSAHLADETARVELLNGMRGNGAWVPAILPTLRALIEKDDEAAIDQVVTFLGTVSDPAQEYLVPFLASFLDKGEAWRRRILWTLNWIRTWRAPGAVELYENIVTRDNVALGHMFEFRDMARLHPASFARLARTLLTRAANAAYPTPGSSGVTVSGAFDAFAQTDFAEALSDLAAGQPEMYIDTFLPWLVDLLAKISTDRHPRVFGYDSFGFAWRHGSDRVTTQIVDGVVNALVAEAASNDTAFRAHLAQLEGCDSETAQMMAASVYARCIDRADGAILFLLGDPRRLTLGEFHERTRTVIATAVSHATNSSVASLEDAVFAYKSPFPPRDVEDLRREGIYQYYLLAAIPEARLSKAGRRRLGELQRKFPKVDTAIKTARQLVTMHSERSPIASDRASKMSDEDWRRAIAKYHRPTDPFKASPRQLAESLKVAAKADPPRFVRFFDALPDTAADEYVAALVNAFGEVFPTLPPTIVANITRFARRATSDLRRQIAWMLQKHATAVDDALLDILEGWVRDASLDDKHDRASLDYLNADRGAAFLTAMYALRVRDTDDAHARRWVLFDYAVADGVPFLRAAALEELRYELFRDNEDEETQPGILARAWQWITGSRRSRGGTSAQRALTLFEEMTAADVAVLGGVYADDFVRLALSRKASRVLPVIETMLNAGDPELRERGASLSAIAAVSPNALTRWQIFWSRRLVRRALRSDDTKVRVAVANVLAHNVSGPAKAYVVRRMTALLHDREPDVRRALSIVFRDAPEALVQQPRYLRAYAASPAVVEAEHVFGDFLLDHMHDDPRVGLDLVEAAVPRVGSAKYPHGDDLMRYVLRVASSTITHDPLLRRAMDVFDDADARFGWYASGLLAEWDRP